MRTPLAGEAEDVCSGVGERAVDCSGETEGEENSSVVGERIGVADSCPAAIRRKPIEMTQASEVTRRNLSIVAPVHLWKNVVPPFAIAQKLFIECIGDKLIVQTIEASKVTDCSFSGVFACSAD